jgi:3-methyl-2-oxobutanoate hydroxymethyltransferase
MPDAQPAKFTLNDLRAARDNGQKIAMLTCYDYTTARLMQSAGVPALLVGDSAANVILGYETTLPVPLAFMIEITRAVRRGAPGCLVVGDMPFGSYQGSVGKASDNVLEMVKQTGCDCVKIEVAAGHARLVRRLADAGVAVMAHLGLRPQTVGLMGGYRYQGRTAAEARLIVETAERMADAGAAALLLEAVPDVVSAKVIEASGLPVIGCGAGPSCHGHVVVTHDIAALTDRQPKFAPPIANLAEPWRELFKRYVQDIESKNYPTREHGYDMPAAEAKEFLSGGQPF